MSAALAAADLSDAFKPHMTETPTSTACSADQKGEELSQHWFTDTAATPSLQVTLSVRHLSSSPCLSTVHANAPPPPQALNKPLGLKHVPGESVNT